jgi:alkylation response protein AidB-like acyl-CoA dehydrogenase
MDFTLSEEQLMFAETARTLFADTVTPDHWRRLMEAGESRDAARWQAIVDTGLTALLLPERAGGLGLAELDFALIAEAAGYVALPDPLVESAGIAAPMLAALAPDHPALADPAATIAIEEREGAPVADADSAAAIILRRGDEAFVAAPADVRLARRESIDPFRRLFAVEWDASSATALGTADWELARDRGALFAAAQGLGLAQRAVAYAQDRQQFGKPIGSYQAVKHQLSTAQVGIEFARPVVLAAAADIAKADVHARARISHAKIVALETADLAARTAIQVHGAMGYSWEVDVHLFLKRALALTGSWGTPGFHRARVAARLFGQPTGPEFTFARDFHHA